MNKPLPIILFIGLTFSLVFAQYSAQENYALLYEEARLVSRYADSSRKNNALLDSARVYAGDGLWDVAVVFLEFYLEQKTPAASGPPINRPLAQLDKPAEFRVLTGVDFNRQEFELGLIQSDSVLKEQISKPFVRLEMEKSWAGAENMDFALNAAVRFDKENMSAYLRGQSIYSVHSINLFFDAGAIYDKNRLYPEFTSFEAHSRQQLLWQKSASDWELRLDNMLRYKKYEQVSDAVPGFLNNVFRADLNYIHRYFINYTADLNESIKSQTNDYLEQTLYLQTWQEYFSSWRINLQLGAGRNRFSYALEDSLIRNTSRSLLLDFQSLLALSDSWQWKEEYHLKSKTFADVSEQDANYLQHQLKSALRQRLFESFSWEVGYQYESRKHSSFSGAQAMLIDEQNYYENGLLLGFDYQRLSGLFISVSASYNFRRYPQAVSGEDLSLYSNRDILNLSLFMQIPISASLYFSALASYDNDRDKDRDEGNIRSSLFSAELQYRF